MEGMDCECEPLPQPLSSSVSGVKLRAGGGAACCGREEGNYVWLEEKDGDRKLKDTEREREKKRVRK